MPQLGKRSWSNTYKASATITASEQETFFQGLHDALLAVGLVQTSDSGQIGTFAGLAVNATTTFGYRVYRFDDALQASSPVFLKVSFKLFYPGAAGSFSRVEVSVGTGTNNAGTLTGATPVIDEATFNAASATQINTAGIPVKPTSSYVSAGPGYLWVCLHANAVFGQQRVPGSYPGRPEPMDHPLVLFGVCRNADAAGTPIAGGVSVLTTTGVAGYTRDRMQCRSLGFDGTTRFSEQAFSATWLDAAPAQAGKVAVARGYGWYAGASQALSPLFAFAGVGNQAMAQGDTVQLALYGSTPRTFLLPDQGAGPLSVTPANTLIRTALIGLWEGPTV